MPLAASPTTLLPACSLPIAREKHNYGTNEIPQVNYISLREAGPAAVFLGGVCHANGMAYLRRKGYPDEGPPGSEGSPSSGTTHSTVDVGRPKAGQGDPKALGAFPLWGPRAAALPGWALVSRTRAGHMEPVFSWVGGQAARKKWLTRMGGRQLLWPGAY